MLFAQSGMTIRSGGAVTVNGNLIITPQAFVCSNPFTDSRDGKTYNTVLIGTQCWMKENLNVGSEMFSSYQTNNNILEKYCYNDNSANCDIYGGLYQWGEAMQYSTTEGVQGICPTGWHLPTDAEWTTLTTFLGDESVAGGKMKETGTAHWASPNTGATNSSGFTALGGGDGGINNVFENLTVTALFWSSSQNVVGIGKGWFRGLINNGVFVVRENAYTNNGFSVRCLKD